MAELQNPKRDVDWASLAEAIFVEMDLDRSGYVEHSEMERLFGSSSTILFSSLKEDGFGRVSLKAWMNFVASVFHREGRDGALSLLHYCDEAAMRVQALEDERVRRELVACTTLEAERRARAERLQRLDQKLVLRPDRGALEARKVLSAPSSTGSFT